MITNSSELDDASSQSFDDAWERRDAISKNISILKENNTELYKIDAKTDTIEFKKDDIHRLTSEMIDSANHIIIECNECQNKLKRAQQAENEKNMQRAIQEIKVAQAPIEPLNEATHKNRVGQPQQQQQQHQQ